MGLSFATWMGAIDPAQRAEVEWLRIEDKPTDVVFSRLGSKLPEQRIRLEMNSAPSESESAAGVGMVRKGTIFGIQHHATLPDTDIEKGDRFILAGEEYRVIGVNREMFGQVQAGIEVVG